MSAGLGEIGRRLREARLAKGISLAEAEEQTKIRRRYLEAIEAGAETVLPGEVYTQGFIRSYGNFLGLDGPALVAEYKRLAREAEGARREEARNGAQERQAAEKGAEPPGEAPRAPAPPALPRPRRPRRSPVAAPVTPARPRGRARGAPARRWLVGLGLAALALALLWLLYRPPHVSAPGAGPGAGPGPAASRPAPSGPPASGPTPPDRASGESGGIQVPPPPPEHAPEPPPPPVQVEKGPRGPDGVIPISVTPGPIQLDLAIHDRVWMRVVADGKEVLSAELYAGDSRSFAAQERIDLVLGWLDPVDFTVNGKSFGALGKGGPARVRITVPAQAPAP